MDAQKVVINNQEYDLPEGFTKISNDGLYFVAWELLERADELKDDEKEFRFFNPRHLGNYELDKDENNVEIKHGQGFSKEEMKDLLADIQAKGLDYGLQAYFVLRDGEVKARIHDGERRHRCIERMRDHDMKVWNKEANQFAPAKEVYGLILCRVESMTEEEAFMRAVAISETSVKWGDGANARLVKTLYKQGKKDEEICKLLNKSKPWLAETSSIVDLDDFCFNFLLAGNINRKVALDLAKVDNVELRQSWLKGAWKDALEQHMRQEAKNQKLLEKAEDQEALAEAEVEEAKAKGASEEEVTQLEEAAAEAGDKTKKRKQIKAASAKPMVKSKNLRKANGFLNALRAPKIKKLEKAVDEMISKNDTSLVDMKILNVLKVAYQCILDGEEDVNEVLKKLAS